MPKIFVSECSLETSPFCFALPFFLPANLLSFSSVYLFYFSYSYFFFVVFPSNIETCQLLSLLALAKDICLWMFFRNVFFLVSFSFFLSSFLPFSSSVFFPFLCYFFSSSSLRMSKSFGFCLSLQLPTIYICECSVETPPFCFGSLFLPFCLFSVLHFPFFSFVTFFSSTSLRISRHFGLCLSLQLPSVFVSECSEEMSAFLFHFLFFLKWCSVFGRLPNAKTHRN